MDKLYPIIRRKRRPLYVDGRSADSDQNRAGSIRG